MKRKNNLFPSVTDFQNIYNAYRKAKKGKTNKEYVLQYSKNLERNLLNLQERLKNQTYQPGKYNSFTIYDPKKRLISCAPFEDRIVHHTICNIIEPIFEKTFIDTSFANRKGMGTHRAVKLFSKYAENYNYVLQCDIKKYFPSIDHEILKKFINKKIKDKPLLDLIDKIIDNSNEQEKVKDYFSGDTLFTPFERKKGLPIGNLTSQIFANIYLNELDHLIKEKLNCPYIRYVDDFVLFSNHIKDLNQNLVCIIETLDSLRLKLHENKSKIHKTKRGINFLGYKLFPNVIQLKRENVRRFRFRVVKFTKNEVPFKKILFSLHSWNGYTKHCTSKIIKRNPMLGIAV